ncbi:MAG TPA: hypothetical protein VN682_16990 [Terriglobales bacterium]|nr:hypothetical protein [Terriglobales bacterium]
MSYVDKHLRIWVVGVRERAPKRKSEWTSRWHPTSRAWHGTRKECQAYIDGEIAKSNFEYYEYKPLRYRPA